MVCAESNRFQLHAARELSYDAPNFRQGVLRKLLIITFVIRHESTNALVHTSVRRFVGVFCPRVPITSESELTFVKEARRYSRFPHPGYATFSRENRPS